MIVRAIPLFLAALLFVSGAVAQTPERVAELKAIVANKQAKEPERLSALMSLTEIGPKGASAADAVVEVLEEKSEHLRLNAALALGRMGKDAVAPLLKALDHKDGDVRFYGVWAVGWIGPEAKEAAGKVVALLADPHDGVRRKAAYALGRIAPQSSQAIAELFKAMTDKNGDVRLAAAEALVGFGPPVLPTLRTRLAKDQPEEMRRGCLELCAKLGPGAKDAVPEVRQAFLESTGLRQAAGQALSKIGKDALPVLREGLKSDRAELRLEAVQALGRMGAEAGPELVDALGNANAEVRRAAAQALAPMRIADKMVVLGLAHVLADEDQATKTAAMQGLINLGTASHWAVPKVLQALPDPALRDSALRVLSVARGEPKEVIPALTKMFTGEARLKSQILRAAQLYGSDGLPLQIVGLKDAEPAVRQQALFNLSATPGDLSKHLDEIKPLLKDPQVVVRRAAVSALGRMGEAGLPDLIALLKDGDAVIRSNAAGALRLLGPAAKKAFDELVSLAGKDPDLNVRRNAVTALGALGKDSVAPLARLLGTEKQTSVRMALMTALGQFGADAKEAVPALTAALGDKLIGVRSTAATALGGIGPEAREAIPALERIAAQDPNAQVRTSATMALARIKDKK